MIKSENGVLTIDGTAGQVLFDFAHIYGDLIKVQPEIVAATVLHYGDKLESADMNMKIVKGGEMLLSHIAEDDEDEDDE